MSGQLDNCAVCGLSLDDHWLATCPENADCANPVTWDGAPVYSPATVAEGLFDGGAFEQMPGQTGWYLIRCHCCRQDFYTDPAHRENYCPQCMELGGDLCISRRAS